MKKQTNLPPVVPESSPVQTGKIISPKTEPFPIVGMGASAGGLEALEQFFTHMPGNCGMAFVIIQHLDPNYKGIMPELLQRITPRYRPA